MLRVKNLTIAIITIFTIGLFSCADQETAEQNTDIENPSEQVEETGAEEVEQQKIDDHFDSKKILEDKKNSAKVRKELLDNNPALKAEFNTTSTYKYLTTTPEFSIIGLYVQQSIYAKKLHGEQITFLAPNNDAFARISKQKIKDLLKEENKDKLNTFIAGHILQGLYFSEKIDTVEDEILNLNGKLMEFDGTAELEVNGTGVIRHDIRTDMGIIIPLKEPFDFPL